MILSSSVVRRVLLCYAVRTLLPRSKSAYTTGWLLLFTGDRVALGIVGCTLLLLSQRHVV